MCVLLSLGRFPKVFDQHMVVGTYLLYFGWRECVKWIMGCQLKFPGFAGKFYSEVKLARGIKVLQHLWSG